MKLKCDLHGSRVVAVDGKFIHRNGRKNVPCSSKTATIGTQSYGPTGMISLQSIKNH